MFESIPAAPPDAILGLNEAFKADTSPRKVNLGVGVFKDESGITPVLRCVKEAERRLVEQEQTKSYLPINGNPDYGRHVPRLLFGDAVDADCVSTIQSPGGTGALRVAGDFIKTLMPTAKIWLSAPTWANHPAVFTAAGVHVESYRYFDSSKNALDFDGLMQDLATIPEGDVVLLHGCCHNPTGVDPSIEQWKQIGERLAERKLLPLVDFAYQGFADGIGEDFGDVGVLVDVQGAVAVLPDLVVEA